MSAPGAGMPDSPLRIRNWSDMAAFATILLMAIAGITWGLKLESRVDQESVARTMLAAQVAGLQAKIDAGTLPLTAERLATEQRQIDEIKGTVAELHRVDDEIFDRIIGGRSYVPLPRKP